MLLVRRLDAVCGVDTLLTAEPGRVPISPTPPPVLASRPSFGLEEVARALDLQARGGCAAELAEFIWIGTARGAAGSPAAVRAVEVRLVRAGTRAAVVRRRTRTE